MLKENVALFPKVGIILINWNQGKDTSSCLLSLRGLDYPNYEIVLVDNASTDGSPDRIKAAFPGIVLIKNKENLGFAEGNNVGIRYLMSDKTDYVLLLNNDTEVEPNFLSELVKEAERHNDTGIVGPKILFFDRPDKIWYAGGFFNAVTGKTYHRGQNEADRGQYDLVTEVGFVSGCAMLIKRAVLEKLKGLDPDYFYSHEDVDLCLRAKALGYKLLYIPASRIKHKIAMSSGGRFSPLYIYYRVRNSILFMQKNKFPFWQRAYSFLVNPAKMIVFTLLICNFKGAFAAFRGWLDYVRGKSGKGPF